MTNGEIREIAKNGILMTPSFFMKKYEKIDSLYLDNNKINAAPNAPYAKRMKYININSTVTLPRLMYNIYLVVLFSFRSVP